MFSEISFGQSLSGLLFVVITEFTLHSTFIIMLSFDSYLVILKHL